MHPTRGVPVANVIYNPFDRTEIERKIGEGYKLFSVFLDVQLFRQSLERLYDEVRAALWRRTRSLCFSEPDARQRKRG